MKYKIPLILCICIAILLLASCTKHERPLTAAELLDLGEKYLLEMNYERALVQFLKVIEIEPMNPRGYTGAAEAYVGLDENDKAVVVLHDGLNIMHGNLVLQAELDKLHLSESAKSNITGAGIFDFEDLEEWGFPWGISMYELQEKGLITIKEQNPSWVGNGLGDSRWEKTNEEGIVVAIGATFGENPEIQIDDFNQLIDRVHIREGDTAVGPRGIKIGMTTEDVVRLFMCEDEAFELIRNTIANNLEGIRPFHPIMFYDTGEQEDEYREEGLAVINGDGIIRSLIYRFYVGGLPGVGCSLGMEVRNNIVTGISVEYSY